MTFPVRIHFNNATALNAPHLWLWVPGSDHSRELAPSGSDAYGPFYDFSIDRNYFRFKFKDGTGLGDLWETAALEREHWPLTPGSGTGADEIWCSGETAFVYHVPPKAPATVTAGQRISGLSFANGVYLPDTGGLSGLGAHPLAGGGVLFGLYHPNAARVYVAGDFNGWQCPGSENPDPGQYIELERHTGWFGMPNTWLTVVPNAKAGDEYEFFVEGGVPRNQDGRARRWQIDPYARRLGPSFEQNRAVVENPSTFSWTDAQWRTPNVDELILYELSVYGFTEADPDITPANRGRFAGITERIRSGYFDRLGPTALSLMPLAEFPSMQSPDTLGYNPSLFFTVERDFGTPDDLRTLVDAAHNAGLAVLLDQVFNHTDNAFNPLWGAILEHPSEDDGGGEGGVYFSGSTDWGNRVATEKQDAQNMLIDACKLFVREYHVDGFRFDATHTHYIDHSFLIRLARELKTVKPDVLLIAENLPNQPDLNGSGFDGYAQWCDGFHDNIKPLLCERTVADHASRPEALGDMFYFSKSEFAAHTNNVVNYCESHDENSVPHEIGYTPWLNHPAAKDRKARLGLFASIAALGQPMLYMGQEFNVERPRNIVTVHWPHDLDGHGFFQWASRLIRLRRRYPGLRLSGYDPAADGRFAWILGPWMDGAHGAGHRIIGWRSRPTAFAHDTMVVMLNFEGSDQVIDVELGLPGVWVKLADIDCVNDIPPHGTNTLLDATVLRTNDGRYAQFVLPSSSAFVYKWEAP